jgi:RHH-type proline utilization regulon transcriptional repressor/proline dehydrogenase/delta 1-pyrroline-5-carboxylate dehydrogenase
MPQHWMKTDAFTAISPAAYLDEHRLVSHLLSELRYDDIQRQRVFNRAFRMVMEVRDHAELGLDAFLQEYSLDKREGVLIMCLAEAMLRIPDTLTVDALIKDKFRDADWSQHRGKSESLLVNASTWGLMLTGGVLELGEEAEEGGMQGIWKRLVSKSGEPVIRKAFEQAMRIMGRQFILGRDVTEALKEAKKDAKQGYLHSFDILGEAARNEAYAQHYISGYKELLAQLAPQVDRNQPMHRRPGVSIKLSGLHPRYEFAQSERVRAELVLRLKELLLLARDAGIIAAIDAEEAARLDISLEVFHAVYTDPAFKDYEGIGLVVQAYQKRAPFVIDWLAELARLHGRQIPVRLVKGAYWDAEIKHAQVQGLLSYPVYTRKENTDLAYMVCVQKLLDYGKLFYPQFATHNAHTMAFVLEMANKNAVFEFQRLHGMGEALQAQLLKERGDEIGCRIYAPIGTHVDLLAYLVRRLLENGANTSFINRMADKDRPIDGVIEDPTVTVSQHKGSHMNPRIALPQNLYGASRPNALGAELSNRKTWETLSGELERFISTQWQASPIIGGKVDVVGETRKVMNPANPEDQVGVAIHASEAEMERAVALAAHAQPAWDATPASQRAAILRRAGDLMEARMPEAMAICIREAGKGLNDAIAEVREAVDFCRYYADQCEAQFAAPLPLPGPTGEANSLELHGRGVAFCISPWNFPLAIFTGQVVAALAAGNSVLAKPAEQTALIGAWAVKILHEAGVPAEALHFLPGSGRVMGAKLLPDPRVMVVAFTGSTETARTINQTLAARNGPIAALIAETGGQNAMIVDSSALPEQVVDDVIRSAFHSAGQRCSALRVLYLQEEIADKVLDLLKGAMQELRLGDPWNLATDIGPVIDAKAQTDLNAHIARMRQEATLIAEVPTPTLKGSFVTPTAFEIPGIDVLTGEVFGPILHVVRFKGGEIDKVVDAINATGFGLTLGVHSRIEAHWRQIMARAKVGNLYINRSMIGAVVGVQPFGGEGLSGTGPKAGGPHYLPRFAVERTRTINTAAIGGNLELIARG